MNNENRFNKHRIEENPQLDEPVDYTQLKLTREELVNLFEESSMYVMKV